MLNKITLKAGGIVFENNSVYIVFRENLNDYTLPKGRLEEGETLKECALREIEEETGVFCEIVDFCKRVDYSFVKDGEVNNCMIFFYLMKPISGELKKLADDVSYMVKVDVSKAKETLTYDTDTPVLEEGIKLLSIKEENYVKRHALYEQSELNDLGDLQIMDIETLVWISKESKILIQQKNYNKFSLKFAQEEISLLKDYFPKKSDYLNQEHFNSIHGVSHTLRVILNVFILCKLLNKNIDRDLLLAGFLHDLHRITDKRDDGHGARVADYLLNNKNKFSGHNIDVVEAVVKYHDVDYDNIPNDIYNQYGPQIDLFKCADALDRYRLPNKKWWPNANFLRMPLISNEKLDDLMNLCGHITLLSELHFCVSSFENIEELFLSVVSQVFNGE